MKKIFFPTIMLIIVFQVSKAQTDSLIFRNGNFIVGEVKKMDRNVVKVKTPYSDKDFEIKWNRIKEIYTETYFLISLSDGSRYNGTLHSTEPGRVAIITEKGRQIKINIIDIVFLDDLDKGFWSQLYFSIDVGVDLAKAHNFKQISTHNTIGYTAKRYSLDTYFNTLFSRQDESEDIKRTDGGVSYRYFMPGDWYPLASVTFLSNTEQKLNLRTTWKIGMGKYVVHTNEAYWGFILGTNYNNENFSDETTETRRSWEGFLGSELNMFNIGDLDLLTGIFVYPSFTEKGRWRIDYTIDTKYEMWFDDDFYIKLSFNLNFDNQPAEGASETDYVFHTGFGWEW
jgi:putative salt-induced outer membrane protein YdiY